MPSLHTIESSYKKYIERLEKENGNKMTIGFRRPSNLKKSFESTYDPSNESNLKKPKKKFRQIDNEVQNQRVSFDYGDSNKHSFDTKDIARPDFKISQAKLFTK